MTEHPGLTIRTMLAERGMSQVALCRLTGLTAKHVNLLVQAKAPLSADVAVRIELALGVRCADTLVHAQGDHDLAAARVEAFRRAQAALELLEAVKP